MRSRLFSPWVAALAVLMGLPHGVPAQSDTVTVIAGERYGADGLKNVLLGDDYRDLWTTPVRVEVLDLERYAGGLEPDERGGGMQTQVLHLRGADRRRYVFRSVDKQPSLAKEPALEDTPISAIIQDQVSSLHPAAALVVAPLLDAVGVLHVTPRLVIMPDVPALGEFREEFGGLLGTIEERPNEVGDGEPGFHGFTRITGTDRLLERLEESPEDRVDARAYLTARLMDLVLGDWDRHYDQWRWGEVEADDVSYWIPIPRDRDYAFVDYDGLVLRVGRRFAANAVKFRPEISNIPGLTLNAQALDRRLLTEVERPVWDSIAGFLQARLTDEVIENAVRQMPPEYAGINAAPLARALKARRDDLARAGAQFYERLASEVDVRATDGDDLAIIDRVGDDVVEVRLYGRAEEDDGAEPTGAPYYRRRFRAAETNEVRVYLRGGDDRAVVRGDVRESLMVRVIGGGGDDVLVDSSVVRGDRAETAFYDARGDNRFVRGKETRVDTRPYDAPPELRPLSGQGFRDWGSSWSVRPYVDYQSTDGLIVGGGPVYTRSGFRREPFAYRLGARAFVGLGSWNVAADAFGQFHTENSRTAYSFYLKGSRLENFRFFGFGNDTEPVVDRDLYLVQQDQLLAEAAVTYGIPADGLLSVGPVIKYTNPDVPEESPIGELPRYGNGGFGQIGARAEAVYDFRDESVFPTSGAILRAEGSGYPAFWSADGPFGSALAEASAYLTARAVLPLTLALRAGGQKVWGDFPVHEAAFLGGSRTIRGYTFQRFAGDAALFGNAELRAPITDLELLVRGRLGATLLADAGRVYFEGESQGGWHTALGGGLWFLTRIRDSPFTVSVTYAHGEEGRLYLKLGVPY